MSASGDSILIRAIRQLGKQRDVTSENLSDGDTETEEDERCESLADFSTDFVLESVAKFINLIETSRGEEIPFANVKPPPSMSARYNMSSKLAEYLQKLGYPGGEDLGYQTFLYGTEKELRNVFLFLLDKMPKEKEPTIEAQTDKKTLLKMKIKSEVSQQLGSHWAPASAFPSGLRPNQDGSFSRQGIGGCDDFCSCDLCFASKNSSRTAFDLLPKETRAAYNDVTKLKSPSQLCSSLINYNEALKIVPDANVQAQEVFSEIVMGEKAKELKPEVDVLTTSINSKTSSEITSKINVVTQKTSKEVVEMTTEVFDDKLESRQLELNESLNDLKVKRDILENELMELQKTYKSLRNETMVTRKENTQESSTIIQLEKELESLVENAKRRDQIMTLLPEGESNLSKLQSIVGKSKEKLNNLRIQWEEHKRSLELEHEQLLAKIKETELNEARAVGSVSKLRSKISELEREIQRKEILAEKYSAEVAKLKKSVPRSVYTRQILDILSNISKQRIETSKIIEDVKSAQKDINLLDGKLYRTYIEADNKVFELAKTDPSMVSVYRGLTDLHKESSAIVELVRQVGQTKRSTRAINDQISSESSKKSGDKVEKLQQDLEKIKAENRLLKEKLKSIVSK